MEKSHSSKHRWSSMCGIAPCSADHRTDKQREHEAFYEQLGCSYYRNQSIVCLWSSNNARLQAFGGWLMSLGGCERQNEARQKIGK
jgi:hypothetical protein